MKTMYRLSFFCLLLAAGFSSCKKVVEESDKVKQAPMSILLYGNGTVTSPTRIVVAHDSLIGVNGGLEMHIKIWADYGDNAHFNHEEIVVDTNYVLIGGGARVSDFSNSSSGVNALLCAAYPANNGNFNRFIAESKDHINSYGHRLWVYAIGMKISKFNPQTSAYEDIPSYRLKDQMHIAESTSGSSSAPSASAVALSGYTTLSGGARLYNSGAYYGRLLTGATVDTIINRGVGGGKDHYYSDPGVVTAYAVTMQNYNPDNPSEPLFEKIWNYTSVSVVTSNQSAFRTVASGYLLAGVGALGWSGYTYWGRLLVGFYPTGSYSATATSKDHIASEVSGMLHLGTMEIKPW